MVGATMIESMDRNRITARSMLELLGSAYALHPSFGEAEIVEIGVDARPAFPDNLPRFKQVTDVSVDGIADDKHKVWMVNGLFRHGFLLSPSLAIQVADAVLDNDLDGAFYYAA